MINAPLTDIELNSIHIQINVLEQIPELGDKLLKLFIWVKNSDVNHEQHALLTRFITQPPADKILIDQKEYDDLYDESMKLMGLEQGGVSDWTWYDTSLEYYRNWKAEKEAKENEG